MDSADNVAIKRLVAGCAVLLLTVGCGGNDTVDTNPGKGNDGVGNPTKPGDQGDKGGHGKGGGHDHNGGHDHD